MVLLKIVVVVKYCAGEWCIVADNIVWYHDMMMYGTYKISQCQVLS